MGIVDLFRPKYRHSDVKVRLEAVKALSPEQDSDLLATIARNDREAQVRRIAIEKLDEADQLAEISRDDKDRTLRDLAGARAAELWVTRACGADTDAAVQALDGLVRLGDQRALVQVANRAEHASIRSGALSKIDDQRSLAELAKTTSHGALRTQALAAISDSDVLAGLAIDAGSKELALAALDRFDDVDLLERTVQKSKHKTVKQRASKKLEDLAERARAAAPRTSDAIKRRRAEQAQLLREVEAVVETHEWDKSLTIVRRAEAEWTRLAGADEPAVEDRFQKAIKRYHARRNAAVGQAEAQRAAAEDKRRADERRDAEARDRRAAEERERVERVEGEAVAAEPAVDDAESRARAEERAREREARRADDDARRVADEADRAAKKAEYEERGKQIAASLDALIGDLASMFESKDGRAIDRLLQQAAKAFEGISKVPGDQRGDLETRYQAARAQLVIRIQDLREAEDWQRWANVPRAEALIKEAQALADSDAPDLNALKQLQARWKTVGAVPQKKNAELWDKFKATCDAAFDKFRAARVVEDEQAAGAIAVKEGLIAQAEALSESTDWVATAEAFKELQRQWKDSGNVPRRAGDALWKKFRAACDRFFERRKPFLDEEMKWQVDNLEAKQALCARAEAVVASAPGDGGWGHAITEIRRIQGEWKDIGHVPRKDADEIWARFRAACDGLFAKRDDARDAEVEAQRAELDGVQAELDAIATADAADAVARAVAVRAKLRELAGREIQPDAELAGAVEAMLRQVIVAHPAAVVGTELDPEATRGKRDKLVGKAAELLPKEQPGLSAGLTPEQIVAQLKSAISKNALGDFRGAGADPFEAIAELKTQWAELGPVVGEANEALAARFAEVCDQVIAAARAEGKAEGRAEREREPREPRDDRKRESRDDRPRRERRPRRDDAAPVDAAAAPAAVVVAAGSAVPVELPPSVAEAVTEPVPTPAAVAERMLPPEEPVAEPVPAVDAAPVETLVSVHDAVTVPNHLPPPPAATATTPEAAPEPEPDSPSSGELASDGAPEGDAIDSGWD